MARQLYPRDSAGFMLSAIRRHLRLCRKSPAGGGLIQAIKPVGTNLEQKAQLLEQSQQIRQDAYDDVLLADTDLDNSIRNAFDACKTYERQHPGELLVNKIFSNGGYSDIVRMSYADEPNAADSIAMKIEKLVNNHPVYAMAATIRQAAEAVRQAITLHKDAIRKEKLAEAELEIAKADTIRAYEVNYLDARRKLGAASANRLFPALRTSRRDDSIDETDSEIEDKTA